MNVKSGCDMLDVEREFVNSLAIGIEETIDEVIMMTKDGYELIVET